MQSETLHLLLIVLILAGVFIGFVRSLASPEVIAFCGLAAVACTGILEPGEILQVFSNPAPVAIAAMFVLSAALESTGVLDRLGTFFVRVAGTSETRALAVMMLVVAMLSAFVNNTPVVIVFLPIVLGLARSTGLKASRLLIPLSFASILGGTCTLIGTSTNLLVDGVVRQHGIEPFGMFEMTRLGLAFTLVGGIYLMTAGRRLLPDRETLATLISPDDTREFLTTAVIGADSPLIGETLTETALAKLRGTRIIEVRRVGKRLQTPLNKLLLEAHDRVVLKSHAKGLAALRETSGVNVGSGQELGLTEIATEKSVVMEGVIGPKSSFVGKTVRELNFRQKYGVLIIAIHRQGVNLRDQFENVQLDFGDTLLVEGPEHRIRQLMLERDFLSLTEPETRTYRRSKAPFAIGAMVAVVTLAALGVMPIAILALIGALAVILTRCIPPQDAYEAIDWKIIFLIFGMLAVGAGVEKTGAAALVANAMVDSIGGVAGAFIMVSLIYLLTNVTTEFVSNNATAVLLAPLAIQVAAVFGADPRPFLVAVMFASSASFATPIGYQTNTYVFGAGGYQFTDFPRVGVLLNLILWLVGSLLIPVLWPLYP